jgi:hypothetical protein
MAASVAASAEYGEPEVGGGAGTAQGAPQRGEDLILGRQGREAHRRKVVNDSGGQPEENDAGLVLTSGFGRLVGLHGAWAKSLAVTAGP